MEMLLTFLLQRQQNERNGGNNVFEDLGSRKSVRIWEQLDSEKNFVPTSG